MQRARVPITIRVNPGALRSCRRAKRASDQSAISVLFACVMPACILRNVFGTRGLGRQPRPVVFACGIPIDRERTDFSPKIQILTSQNVTFRTCARNPKTQYGDIILDAPLHIGAPLRRRSPKQETRKRTSEWDSCLLI